MTAHPAPGKTHSRRAVYADGGGFSRAALAWLSGPTASRAGGRRPAGRLPRDDRRHRRLLRARPVESESCNCQTGILR